MDKKPQLISSYFDFSELSKFIDTMRQISQEQGKINRAVRVASMIPLGIYTFLLSSLIFLKILVIGLAKIFRANLHRGHVDDKNEDTKEIELTTIPSNTVLLEPPQTDSGLIGKKTAQPQEPVKREFEHRNPS